MIINYRLSEESILKMWKVQAQNEPHEVFLFVPIKGLDWQDKANSDPGASNYQKQLKSVMGKSFLYKYLFLL